MQQAATKIRDFLRLESAGGLALMTTAAFALIVANSPLAGLYADLLSVPFAIQAGALIISKPMILWINDGLMAVFFFLVGLEIKREVMGGELSTWNKAALPVFAAIGGMVVPALFYAGFNIGDADAIRGWAIPAATDIAFALGILALLGSRAPVSLKILLLAIAIIDDLGAIVIIAVFYTNELSVQALAFAGVGLAALFALNRAGVRTITPYAIVGVFLWVCVLKSGVHATLAGVMTALAIPLSGRKPSDASPLQKLEHDLHPWVAFAILPLFAFANAGVSLGGISLDNVFAPIPLGIALGLFLGKQIGVFGFATLAVSTGLAKRPEGSSWMQLYGLACLTGVGLTMSLFIGGLAFDSVDHMNEVRLGVLMGSIASALFGLVVLRLAPGHTKARSASTTPKPSPHAA